ncbi:MAG: metallophosphoesterase [Clostridia bacterium]|nr:metallophosphoesterase [Clostridia bacterium]
MSEINPVVFSVGDNYQIFVPGGRGSTMWVSIGGENYYDGANGVLRSDVLVHKMTVPKKVLDTAQSYTIYKRNIVERKPYFTETEEPEHKSFSFKAPEGNKIRAYHVADAHSNLKPPVLAAKAFGNIDLLILNGDIQTSSESEEEILNIYKIASDITEGAIPVVYARGNHDLRGSFAEYLDRYTPCENGNTFFTFRVGDVWGLVLDCGEDKLDNHAEYGNTLCCESFRRTETGYLREMVQNAESEYTAEGVKHRIVICHMPFTKIEKGEFDIERDVYAEWVNILNEKIKPEFMLCGHKHALNIYEPGGEHDGYGQGFPVIIGSEIKNAHTENHDGAYFIGCGIEFSDEKTHFSFTDSDGNFLKNEYNTSVKK